jgi:hypothetical protein
MADALRSLSYPSLDAVALGSAIPIGIEPLEFAADGLSLLVKVSFIDSGAVTSGGSASTRSAVFVYDVGAQSYRADLAQLIGDQPALAGAPINVVDAQFADGGDRVLVHYTVPARDATPGAAPQSQLAVVDLAGAQPSIARADLIAAVLGQSGIDLYVEAVRLSADGRFVAVQTASPLLLDDVLDNNDRSDIYLIDTQTLTVRRVSDLAGIGPPQGDASLLHDVRLASDGSVQVLFASTASFSNLDDNTLQDLYLWQAKPGAAAALTLVSRQGGKAFGAEAGLLADGQVLFERLVGDEVRLYRTTLAAPSDAVAVSGLDNYYSSAFDLQGLADDGSLLLFSSDQGPGLTQGSPLQAFAHAPSLGITALVSSVALGGAPADDQVLTPLLSPGGDQLAFVSQAGNLGGGDLQGAADALYLGEIESYGIVRNRAPTGSDRTLTLLEDTPYTFTAADFGFTDADVGDSLGAVRIDSLPLASKGLLKLGTNLVTAGQIIEAAQIASFKFEPAAQVNGLAAASFNFSVRDASLFDASPKRISLDITAANDAPTGTVTISGTARQGETLTVSNNLADVDGLGTIGYQWRAGGVNIAGATGSSFTLTQAEVGKVITVVASYTDQQGTAEAVTSAGSAAVANINDAPAGANKTITTRQNTAYTFAATDFGFTDVDTGDRLGAVRIDTLPLAAKGLLKLGTTLVTTGQIIEAAQIPTLKFEPAATVSGINAASFNFSVRDAQLFDASPNTVNLNVVGADWLTASGQVYQWKTHALLVDVDVLARPIAQTVFLSTRTVSDGGFDLSIPSAGQYRTEAARALTSSETGNVISAADALAALKLSVGLNPNADPDGTGPLTAPPVSPYQFLAADVNNDGRVTAADALAILKMAVKRADAPARDWLFVPETQDFWNETALSGKGAFTTTRTSVKDASGTASGLLPADISWAAGKDVNLVAVLKGDVNGSWAAPAGSQPLPDSYFQGLALVNPLLVNVTQFGLSV